jgi:hypothetical protein
VSIPVSDKFVVKALIVLDAIIGLNVNVFRGTLESQETQAVPVLKICVNQIANVEKIRSAPPLD